MRAAVIVPVFGQADLMGEAVASLLAQEGAEPFAILLVDDLCADPRTSRKAAILAAAHPGQVFYWRAPQNGGLSSIRNAGVRRALEFWPELEAVAFVDGDDKVFSRFVARGLELVDRYGGQPTADGGRVGWIYDDWHQFGTPENLHSPAPYNPLFALSGCQHTPGCFCLAEIFREGLWFDENRRGGDAEVWQFWVNCHAHGWRGHHAGTLGFRYRSRIGGLAFEGRQATERNRVLIQKEFPELYHPDSYLAQETGLNQRHLVLDGESGARLGLDGPRLSPAALAGLLIRVAQLPTTAAPAQALICTGAALESLASARLLDWAAWFLEASLIDGCAALTLEPREMSGGKLAPAPPWLPHGRSSIVSVSLVKLARAVTDGCPLSEVIANTASNHHVLTLDSMPAAPAPGAPRLESHEAALSQALAPFDQPAHQWLPETTWWPFGIDRTTLPQLHLGHAAPLSDPGARQASLIVVATEDLVWRAEDLDLAAVASHLERRDGTPPSLCLIGTELPGAALADLPLRSIFLLPSAAVNDKGRQIEPEGILAAFGAVVSLDCSEIIPAMNAVRRFGCRTIAVLPRGDLAQSNLGSVLLNSFKAFQNVLIRSAPQYAHVLSLGCAREIVSRELLDSSASKAMEKA